MTRSFLFAFAFISLTATTAVCQDARGPETKERPKAPAEKPSDATPISDPATPSAKMTEAIEKIRRVKQYDKLVKELERLITENEKLRQQLMRQTAALPTIVVQSKAIDESRALAVLKIGQETFRVQMASEVMIPLTPTETTVMRVKKISVERIELEFPALKRQLVLDD